MTFRKPQSGRKTTLNQRADGLKDRLRRKRLEKRQSLLETLESRQLLAGPDLIGIQPNEGSLLNEGSVLNVSPRELVFRFDDDTVIDADTLSSIQITRAGEDSVFESATATTDMGTNGQVLLEFRSKAIGGAGNGFTVDLTSSNRGTVAAPLITTSTNSVSIELNSNVNSPTRVRDLITGVANNAAANALIEVIQVSGPSLANVGSTVQESTLELDGANAAQAITDFGTNGAVRVRLVSQVQGVNGRDIRLEVEQRAFGGQANPVVVVTDQNIRVQLNSSVGFETTAAEFITAINSNSEASQLLKATLQQGNVDTVIGNRVTSYSPIALSGVSDVVVEPGFVGLGDSAREVVFRFAEPLPDDVYQIQILGTGVSALRNVDGEAFQDGVDLSRSFSINLGPQIAAVVPEPIRRNSNGGLSPDTGKIEVHFNNDDLAPSLATNPSFYQLVFTRDTVNNTDDVLINPTSVTYDNISNIAVLDFGRPLSRINDPSNPTEFLPGAARLRVGASEDTAAPPAEISLGLNTTNPIEPGDSFAEAFDLNTQWTVTGNRAQSALLQSEIFNPAPYGLDLPGPDLPGTRTIRPEDPSRLTRTVPLDYLRNGADVIDGISVIQYNFAPSWLGDDPNEPGIVDDTTYFNIISEQQKVRVREVLQLYSEYLGVNFVEVEGEPTQQAFISIAVGDLYGGDPRVDSGQGGVAVVTRDRNLDGIDDLAVLDFQDFDESIDDQFGGEFFRGSMFAVGQLLGYGYADDLPQPVTQSTNFIFAPGTDNEPAFPSVADIVHGQYLYRPDSVDIDMYRFTVNTSGDLSVETIAERLGVPSLLDSALKLYRADGNGSFVEIAQNDDYFSNDSLIDIRITPGTYMVGVSAKGNTNYDPAIPGTGFGGLSEGGYELRLDFRPTDSNNILDTTGVPLDGDGDGRPGGFFDFWFVPSDANNTLYVDKLGASSGGQLGTVGNPYTEIDQAIAASRPGDTIRVVGNGGTDGLLETAQDNFSYQIGFSNNGLPLADGSTLELPQGVQMIVDAGAVLKFSRSRLGVGSVSPLIDLSNSALQILGTPTIVAANGLPARDVSNAVIPGSVYLTSINDDTVGTGNITSFTPPAQAGDWGGIDFRGDLDAADELRRNRENEGVFLNHVQYADMRYGGGAVSIGGQQVVISPIDMAITRPTIINSRITNSSDAAMAASPDTFTESRFTDGFFQADSPFTPDYSRVGPEIHGNFIADNSINGLFIRLRTRTGTELESITTSTRFDDSDIVHVLTENLVIEGTPGGPIIQTSSPSSLLIRFNTVASGAVAAGTYMYRITNVNSSGIETAASQPTIPVTLNTTGGIQLNQLPTIGPGSDFVFRNLYRATVDPVTGLPGSFSLVAQLNASNTSFVDTVANGTTPLQSGENVLRSRLDASLVVDPGTVIKVDGARIEARFGANVIAEGNGSQPIIFTSLEDQRYGTGGTFDSNNRQDFAALDPGDWGGIYIGAGSTASIDHAVIAGGGGVTRIEGGFASFNAIEVHQGNLRLTNSTLESNADGRGALAGTRVGRSDNSSGTVFVRASQPVIAGNDFVTGGGPALSFDVNSLNYFEVSDGGRSTGELDAVEVVGNNGPLIQGNSLTANAVNGMEIRGGELATGGVWDDVDIVHVVTESIEVPNEHIYGGLRLRSDARGSLVVKFESGDNDDAGIVVGGSLLTAADEFVDIPDRVGGALQLVGHPDFPVVLTTLADDFAGAGFTRDGVPQVDTNNDGIAGGSLAQNTINVGGTTGGTTGGPVFGVLPTGPEVNRGLTIDNDVDINTPGYFEATPGAGNGLGLIASGVTVEDLTTNQILVNQNFVFAYTTYIQVGTTVTDLAATTITQQATLIADDVVESRGTFPGANGDVNWIATSRFLNGVPTLFSSVELDGGTSPLGDVRVISYLDEDVFGVTDDILVTSGTPGAADFRAYTLDGAGRYGFSHGGFYADDGSSLTGATYVGWAADQYQELENQINAGNQAFSIPGTIDLADLPANPDPDFGTAYGPNDVTTAFAWDTNPAATTATVTSFLELLPQDPSVVTPTIPVFDAGLWNGVVIREAAHDRNVAAVPEEEPVRTSVFNTNAIPGQAQFLGELAPDEQSGDENRRLGFVVDGAISTRDDVDVYSFIAESGTEVWFDIDRTGNRLDSVVELVDANGRTLAASNDSILAETDSGALFAGNGLSADAALPLSPVPERLEVQDITVTESIVDATGGHLTLSIAGTTDSVTIPYDAFLFDPANAIENALETTFPDLGDVSATLLRRRGRVIDQASGNTTRPGDDFVIQLRFDPDSFVARSVPLIGISGIAVTGAAVGTSVTERLLDSQLQDAYSTNPKDAGMRLRLPGEAGTRNLYHVRVRSSNTIDPFDFNSIVNGDVLGGQSIGRYELQVRLGEVDEIPGTQVRLADIRYATNGLQIIGQPLHSPLLGEDYETSAPNDTFQTAQPLGYFGVGDDATVTEAGPLQSDRLAKSFAGEIDSATDVDWYRFEVTYENITRDNAALYLSTVFDLDYADNFARSDMALYVFDAAGQLILVGGDSNIADDLPGSASSNDTSDLSRGSAGTEDPFIGAAELIEGTYFVAVSNQTQVPYDQFFNAGSLNPLLRLEPIDSITRIVEDRIGSSGGGTASAPVIDLLFDDESIEEYTLDDVVLYVNTISGLQMVNPFTGERLGTLGGFGAEDIRDIAFASDGDLFAFTGYGPRPAGDQAWNYVQIDTANAGLTTISTGAGFTTHHDFIGDLILEITSDEGFVVEGITIREHLGAQSGFFVGNRPTDRVGPGNGALDYYQNVLYDFDEDSGLATGPVYDLDERFPGAGTTRREIGQIDTTAPVGSAFRQLGIGDATEVDANGLAVPRFADGDSFSLSNGVDVVTFELDQASTIIANGTPIRDGDAIDIDGAIFEFNTGTRLQIDEVAPVGTLTGGSTLTVVGANGQSATFEFTRLTTPAQGNIEIQTVDLLGQPRTAAAITNDLVAAINANIVDAGASAFNDEIFFATQPSAISTTGAGVAIIGATDLVNAGAFAVDLDETAPPETVILALADAIRNAGISVSSAGIQLALPTANLVNVLSGTGLTLPPSGPGVGTGNVPVLLLPTDSADTIGQRIATAIQAANDAGDLPNVTVNPQGRSLSIIGGDIINVSGGFTAGGVPTGGLIRGIELVNGSLYAVDDNGGLFVVPQSQITPPNRNGNRTVGQYVSRATDLVGINFTGLRAGPASVQDAELRDILFGITGNGDIYAFNTNGELQPVFAGGRSVISTGIGGAAGLDFSTLDYNLWHTTGTRGGDDGHGIEEIPGRRAAVPGGASLAFNYEGAAFNGNYDSPAEFPGAAIQSTYNFPGGAKGTVNSNQFSLEGFAADDQPTLYFNYFLANDGGSDRLRVSVVTEDGVEHIVASNTTARGPGTSDDEFDDPAPFGIYDDDVDTDVQQLFDNTGTWRQARVPLNEFAGMSNLALRLEFSTTGVSSTSSPVLRAVSGDQLIEGQRIVINGETFEIDLAPSVGVPSGSEIADLYVNPGARAAISVDGQSYVLDDGTRSIGANQKSIDLFALVGAGVPLRTLSASDIALAVAEGVRLDPPLAAVTSVNFSDPQDDPNVVTGTNDFIFEATPLPYTGGNQTFQGTGRFGTDPADGPVSRINDVDLLRVDVSAGTTISVDVDLDFNSNIGAVVRFFGPDGSEVTAGVTNNVVDGTIQYRPTFDGTVYIGISGDGNDAYDIRVPGSASNGQVDTYTATVALSLPQAILTNGNLVEFGGFTTALASPGDLFTVTGTNPITGIPLLVSRFATADDVALRLQSAVANRFALTDLDYLPTSGASVRLPELTIDDPGPFADESQRYSEAFGSGQVAGAANNNFEGAYLDDFIIGFAERGEVATEANVVGNFFQDQTPNFPVPADPVSNLQTGSYQVEIRDASEYFSSGDAAYFRTFDTNDRLAESRSILTKSADQIRDGQTFAITDGRSTVEFEFDLIESNTGVTPGRVQVPFSLVAIEPGSGELDPVTGLVIPGTETIRPQTATEVALSVIDAINRPDVQSVLEVRALSSSGVDAITDTEINLYGDVNVVDESSVFEAVSFVERRGDENRERDSQGVILIENSRFLYNEQYGVDISHGLNVDVNGTLTPSAVRYPRNLVELNTESLKPGVVVQSNVFAFNEVGGLQITGIDPAAAETGSDPVPFERIVNNTIIGGRITPGTSTPAATFEGILFPQGLASFADVVVEYSPDAGGSPPTTVHQMSASALGAPDCFGRGPEPLDSQLAVSLGEGGSITLGFTDNLLTGSGDVSPDLVVFETGEIESVRVEISRDGISFFDVGTVGGLTNQIDIDAFGFGPEDRFGFVRLTDLRQGANLTTALGADIDAVGALTSVPVDNFTSGGTGINIVGNAAPALLNNVLANSVQGLQIDDTNTGAVLGANTYYRNDADVPANVALGQFAQVLSDSEVIFVGAAELVFAPAAGATIIDSSIDSLPDRSSLTTVRNPLGIPPSPILAPRLDVNGQLRVDDPNVETPSGLGERVFKDRGASDRGDLDGPRAILLSPLAPGIGIGAGVVSVFGQAPSFFDIQLVDGLPPADIVPGTGVNDGTVTSGSILLLKDNLPLVEGVDYRFGYNLSTNIIRLTPIAGVWEPDSTYVIRMIDSSDAVVAAFNGSTYVDGDRLTLLALDGSATNFEYETGLDISISQSVTADVADGITFDIFDGNALLTYEFDNNGLFDSTNNAIEIPLVGSSDLLAQDLADAINATPALSFTATVSNNVVRLLGGTPLSTVTSSSNFVQISGAVGTSIGFGIQIPFAGAAPDGSLEDGQTFIVRRGAVNEALFEFDNDGFLDNEDQGAIRVSIPLTPSLDDIADSMVRAIGGAGLGLSPTNQGFGRVFLGGDANYSVDLTGSFLQQLGIAGQGATVPIEIPIDRTDLENAVIVQSAIDAVGLPGVETSIVDRRVFIEGTTGVGGTGAVDVVTITDEVGNELQTNQANGRTELTIFVGGGFDYGDAPAPYTTLDVDGGPRHGVDPSFALGQSVDADSNGETPNRDLDDGVALPASIQAGFDASVQVEILNPNGREFYLDAWFDWDGDGQFELNEVQRFSSSSAPFVSPGVNSINVDVPNTAQVGEIYARFRLSEVPNLGPIGDAPSGEVEDYRIIVSNNPFQNPTGRHDVNASGSVTPLDALQIINALRRATVIDGEINLSSVPLPELPPFPDVNGDGKVTALDAVNVINELAVIFNSGGSGEGELVSSATSFVPAASGVLASTPTAVGNALIDEATAPEQFEAESKVSVFDDPAVVQADSMVDVLAADTAAASAEKATSNEALDRLFAEL